MDQKLELATEAQNQNPMEQDRLFVFVHIPKTAGTSLRNALAKQSDVCLDYGPDDEATSPNSKSVMGDEFVADPRTVYFGHYNAAYIDGRFDGSVVRFSWVRDPVDRVISAFMHDRWINAQNTDLEDPNTLSSLLAFVSDPYQQNVMSGYVSDQWETFDFIGVVEHRDVSIRRFNRRLLKYGLIEAKISVAVENVNPGRGEFYYRSNNEALISFITMKNMRDVILYRSIVNKYIGR